MYSVLRAHKARRNRTTSINFRNYLHGNVSGYALLPSGFPTPRIIQLWLYESMFGRYRRTIRTKNYKCVTQIIFLYTRIHCICTFYTVYNNIYYRSKIKKRKKLEPKQYCSCEWKLNTRGKLFHFQTLIKSLIFHNTCMQKKYLYSFVLFVIINNRNY